MPPSGYLTKDAVSVLRRVSAVVATRDEPSPKAFDDQLLGSVRQLANRLAPDASPRLKEALREVVAGLTAFRRHTPGEAIAAAGRRQGARRKPRGRGV
jgi:hypothetical protein